MQPLEDPQVGLDDARGLPLLVDVLAQERRVGVEAAVVQRAQDLDALVERLPGDEARGAEAHPVATREAADRPAARRREDGPAQAGVDGTGDPSAQRGRSPKASRVSRAAATPSGM